MRHAEILRRVVAMAVLEGRLPCDLYGTPLQVEAIAAALYASRRLDQTLADPRTTLEEATDAVASKRSAAARYRRVFGVRWPG